MNHRRITTLLAFVLTLSACGRKPTLPVGVVATVGDRQITIDDFRKYLERNAGTELNQVAPEAASALLDQFVEEILVSEHALKAGIDVSSDKVAVAVRNDPGSTAVAKKDEMRRAALIDRLTAQLATPTEEEIRRYYEENRADFKLAERVRVRQILLHDGKEADQLRKKIAEGESFESIASQFSQAPNGKQGGDIGYVTRGQLPKLFEEEIFALQPGTVTRVIPTDGSFHIFKVDEHAQAGQIDLETAAPRIRNLIEETALEQELARAVSTARKEIPVSILARRLPFAYTGTYPQSTNE